MKNVLIYPAGTEIGLEIFRALKYQKDFKVFGANSCEDHSKYLYDHVYTISDIYRDPIMVRHELTELCNSLKIDFIFPTHDEVIYELAKVDFPNAILPDKKTAEICRSKRLTYETFDSVIEVPKVFDKKSKKIIYPVFCKPDKGQGSRGTFKVNNKSEFQRISDELILEYLPGREFTVDCFTDRFGKLRYCASRKRSRINAGISTKTEIVIDLMSCVYAERINSNLKLRGQWFFQVKERESGELVLMEIAARAAGSSCLARARGVNLPLLTLYDRMGLDVEIIENDYVKEVDRALENKYSFDYKFQNVFVDLDDTIIGNPEMIGLLYKFRKQGKFIYLLSSHKGSIKEILYDNFISYLFFDDIYQTDTKTDYIEPESIFIDDSFSERKKVSEKYDIPVFDVQQAIEVL
jgi:hypothetical protein